MKMKMYLPDKKRVELCLVPYMLWVISSSAQAETEKENKDLSEILENLRYSCFEPLEECNNKEKLKRRIKRISDEVLIKNYEKKPLYFTFLVVVLWVKKNLDDDVFVLMSGSKLDMALKKIIECLEQHPELFERFYDEAINELDKFTTYYLDALLYI